MRRIEHVIPNIRRAIVCSLLLIGLITLRSKPVFAQKAETIEAQAMGTGTQLGQNIGITLIIQDFSTMARDRLSWTRSRRDRIRAWSTRLRR
jgi:hypothetical protein